MRITFAFPVAAAADADALAVLLSGPEYDGGFGPVRHGGWAVSSWEADLSPLQTVAADGAQGWVAALTAPGWPVDLAAAQRAWALVDVDAATLIEGRAMMLTGMDGPGRMAEMLAGV